jgi:2-oxoglutarate ferredoxin oxidoreductase subunit alpha
VIEEVYGEFFASVQSGLIVELSHQGQLYRVLRMFLDLPAGVQPMCRSGANPFRPREVLSRLRESMLALQGRGGTALQPQE